ncbi:MAG: DUF721 domain-containing protein [Candidatus Omnitrophota bacterium]|jgi:hypothetical protein|nr:MAG: DUF721 domain-containing protein [Candidatus Omnitrophota bacterium]
MDKIKDIIEQFFSDLGKAGHGSGGIATEKILKKVLTKRELSHIKCNYFRSGVLGIGLDSSAWLYQFNLKKPLLLSRLKEDIDGLKDIKVFLGK